MNVSDSCTLSRSWRRACLAESLSLVGFTCRLPVSVSFIFPEEKEERPTESCSILQPGISDKTNSPIESLCIPQASMAVLISSLLRCISMPYNALSRFNQKLTSCDAVPDKTSLVSLVTTWMAFIRGLTCEWRLLRNVLSIRSFDGMWETLSRWPCDLAFIQVSNTSSPEKGESTHSTAR